MCWRHAATTKITDCRNYTCIRKTQTNQSCGSAGGMKFELESLKDMYMYMSLYAACVYKGVFKAKSITKVVVTLLNLLVLSLQELSVKGTEKKTVSESWSREWVIFIADRVSFNTQCLLQPTDRLNISSVARLVYHRGVTTLDWQGWQRRQLAGSWRPPKELFFTHKSWEART